MIGGVTRHLLAHLSAVPHLHLHLLPHLQQALNP